MRSVFLRGLSKWHWIGVVSWAVTAASGSAMDLVDLVAKVERSVVRIDTVQEASSGSGSGVIIDDRGIILTNFHVVEGSKQLTVTLRSNKLLKGMGYLAIDPTHDLAVLKVSALDKSSAMPLAAELPKIGESVAAFGNPRGFSFTTSEGIVSAIRTGKEIIQSIGSNEYRLDPDATWIQTTAPISPGNSGGPLVSMKGELVGLNTWNYTEGQNLNFAISLVDIKRLLAGTSFDAAPHGFVELPPPRAPTAPRHRPARPGEFKFELPTGRVFSYSIFDVHAQAINQAAGVERKDQVLIRHANGGLYAAASQKGGQLHGITLGQYENQQPMVFATYAAGKRHGNMMTWSESGQALLFAQYNQGKRHGFACWHEDGALSMLLQYKNDTPEWVQLMADAKPLEGYKTRALAEENSRAKVALTKLDNFEAEIKKSEQAFRKQVMEFENSRRRAIAAKLAPEKRRRASARGAAAAAAEDEFVRALWRRALGG